MQRLGVILIGAVIIAFVFGYWHGANVRGDVLTTLIVTLATWTAFASFVISAPCRRFSSRR